MTDKEIIFSLECCDNGKCSECSFAFKGGCVIKLRTRSLDLIKRQQAEIEKARAKAIKEFADRLKGELNNLEYHENPNRKTVKKEELYNFVNWIMRDVVPDEIDDLVKNMVGDTYE